MTKRLFALISGERLYFKADAATRAVFEAKGPVPFNYVAHGKMLTMQYYAASPEVLEERDAMRTQAREAIETALKAGGRKQK